MDCEKEGQRAGWCGGGSIRFSQRYKGTQEGHQGTGSHLGSE